MLITLSTGTIIIYNGNTIATIGVILTTLLILFNHKKNIAEMMKKNGNG